METLTGDKGGGIPTDFGHITAFDEGNYIRKNNFNLSGRFTAIGGMSIQLAEFKIGKLSAEEKLAAIGLMGLMRE